MKKVMVAVTTAMVLASGASANDVVKSANDFFKTAEITVGAGWSHTDDKGNAGFSLSLLSDPQQSVYSLASGDISNGYRSVSDLVAVNIDKSPDVYAGLGYLKAEGSAMSGGMAEDAGVTQTTKESGIYGTFGLIDRLDFNNGMTLSGQVGYRLGGVTGPIASVGVSSMIGDGTYGHEVGLNLNVERIENDKEDIDRVALYATWTF